MAVGWTETSRNSSLLSRSRRSIRTSSIWRGCRRPTVGFIGELRRNPSLAKQGHQPVRTGSQEAPELAVVEDQAHLVATNLDVLEQRHGCTSFSIHSATLALSVLLNSLKEAVGRRD